MAHALFKTPGAPINDRFIVNRNSANFELSHYYFSKKSSSSATVSSTDVALRANEISNTAAGDDARCLPNRSASIRRRLLFETCIDSSDSSDQLDQRVLKFSNKRNENDSRPNLSRICAKGQPRKIALGNEVALDAPGVVDDYYLNLMDWSAKGKIAVGLQDEVYIWDQQTKVVCKLACNKPSPPASQPTRPKHVTAIRYNQTGTELAVSESNKKTIIWNMDESKFSGMSIENSATFTCSLAWNRHLLTCGNKEGAIVLWDTRKQMNPEKSCSLVCMVHGTNRADICGLEWSRNGHYLASGSDDGVVAIWDVRCLTTQAQPKPLYSIKAHVSAAKALDWCVWQSNLLATGGGKSDRNIKIWNIDNRKEMCSMDAGSQVTGLRWSEENKELVSSHGLPNYELSLWKYPTLTKIVDLRGHTDRILAICKSPNNQYIASLGADETLRLWNCLKPKLPCPLSQTPISSRYLSQNYHIR